VFLSRENSAKSVTSEQAAEYCCRGSIECNSSNQHRVPCGCLL